MSSSSLLSLSSPSLSSSSQIRARLKRISRVDASIPIPEVIPLEGKEISIGRSKDVNVVLDSNIYPGMISRLHAKLVPTPTSYLLRDMDSKNGITVNDKRVLQHELRDGDVVIFGGASAINVGSFLAQPKSEFIYKYEVIKPETSDDDEEEEGAFEMLKSLTENFQVVLTWLTSLVLVGNYLFAEEDSEEFSYISNFVEPLFHAVGLPFTRMNFLAVFVVFMCVVVAIVYKLLITKKKKTKKKKN